MLRFVEREKVVDLICEAEQPNNLDRSGRDDFFNSPNISQQSHTGIFINQHGSVQAAADITVYNIQYLRRILRSGTLKGVKISQVFIDQYQKLTSLRAKHGSLAAKGEIVSPL